MTKSKAKISCGQTLFELLIAMAIFALIITPFVSSLINLTSSQVKYRHRIQATQYCREALEIVYNLAANYPSWEDFVTTYADPLKTYYPSQSGELDLIEGIEPAIEGRFSRQIVITKALRNNQGNIDKNDSNPDDNTIEIISRVFWKERNKNEKIEIITYLINPAFF